MKVKETPRLHAVLLKQGARAPGRGVAGHQHQCFLGRRRLHSDAAQAVEIAFDEMAWCRSRKPVVMGEALAPQPMRAVELARDAVARPEQTREPYAARMLGQVNHEIVSPCAQRGEQIALRSRMGDESPVLGGAIDDMDPRNRGVALETRG